MTTRDRLARARLEAALNRAIERAPGPLAQELMSRPQACTCRAFPHVHTARLTNACALRRLFA